MTSTAERHSITALASGFPAPGEDEWRRLAERALGGAALESLATVTHDRIRVPVLATTRDCGTAAPIPGMPRGGAAVRSLIAEPTPEAANAAIREAIAGGADELLLQIEAPGQPGIMMGGPSAFLRALDGIEPGSVAIHLRDPEVPLHGLSYLSAWWNGVPDQRRRGSFGIDTIGAVATGSIEAAWLHKDRLAWDAGMVSYGARRAPEVSVLKASGLPYHEAGASEAQELAAMLATGVAYLRACDDCEVALDAAAPRIALELSADAELFLTIAKLRAARLLWARVLEASGIDDARTRLDVQTSRRMMCAADPHTNMVRTTVAALAANIGGADAVTVLPFSDPIGRPDPFARRIARNTQIILRDEGLVGAVRDPAQRSYAIEHLTGALAAKAWALFQEIEAGGGMVAALQSGLLAAWIEETNAARARDLAAGNAVLVGATAYRDETAQAPDAVGRRTSLPFASAALLNPIRLETLAGASR